MKQVNLYTHTGLKALKLQSGKGGYVLEFFQQGVKDPATLTKIVEIEDMTPVQAELHVINEALGRINTKDIDLTIYTDCMQVAAAFINQWVISWQEKGWKTARGEPVKHGDEYKEILDKLCGMCFSVRGQQAHGYRNWLIKETEGR